MNFIKNIFVPKDDGSQQPVDVSAGVKKDPAPAPKQSALNNSMLETLILDHFKMRMKEQTTLCTVLYPTTFNIYLRQSDYDNLKQAFPVIVDDLTKVLFDRTIRENLTEGMSVKCLAQYWRIAFYVFSDGMMIEQTGGEKVKLDNNQLYVASELYDQPIVSDNQQGRVVVTKHDKDSMSVEQLRINREALSGMEILGNNLFKVAFTSVVSTPPPHPPVNRAVASLTISHSSFKVRGARTLSYQMTSNQLVITGKNDTQHYDDGETLCIDDENVLSPLLVIRRDAERNNQFYIRTYGEIRVNQRRLAVGMPEQLLPNNSSILIQNVIQIKFSIM